MNVVSCYKVVPEEQDISVKPDRSLSFERAEWKIGQYDLPAIEAGMQIVEAVGGKVTLVSAGDGRLDNSKLWKAALSRGPAELYIIVDEGLAGADSYQTAVTLAAAIRKIGFDLVLCGEGSSDLYAQQVGAQLGEQLGINVFNAVSKITPQGDRVRIERTLEREIEVLDVPLPVVLSLTADANLPRIPQMKDILAAGKKPTTKWSLSDLGQPAGRIANVVSTLAPESVDRKQVIIEGDSDENIRAFLQNIRKELSG